MLASRAANELSVYFLQLANRLGYTTARIGKKVAKLAVSALGRCLLVAILPTHRPLWSVFC